MSGSAWNLLRQAAWLRTTTGAPPGIRRQQASKVRPSAARTPSIEK